MNLAYRLVNVFTIGDDPFSGNPLAVFEDGSGLSSEQMQAIARQLNLSETTFVCGLEPVDDDVDATVRSSPPATSCRSPGTPLSERHTSWLTSSAEDARTSPSVCRPDGSPCPSPTRCGP